MNLRNGEENPFGFLQPISKRMDDFLARNFPELTSAFGGDVITRSSFPRLDVIDKSDSIVIKATLPGYEKENISLKLEKDILTISASKNEVTHNTEESYIYKEIKSSDCSRSIQITKSNVDLDITKIKADLVNGILSITLPKLQSEKVIAQEIKIN